jgi:hypothetical protein
MLFKFLPPASRISDKDFDIIETESLVHLSATDRQKINWEIDQYERRCGFDEVMRGSAADKRLLRTSARQARDLSASLRKLAQSNPTMANVLVHPKALPELFATLDWSAEQFETRLSNTERGSVAHYHHLARLLETLRSIFERSSVQTAPIETRQTERRVSAFSKFAFMVLKKTRYSQNSEEALQASWESIRSVKSRTGERVRRFVRPQSRRSRKKK